MDVEKMAYAVRQMLLQQPVSDINIIVQQDRILAQAKSGTDGLIDILITLRRK